MRHVGEVGRVDRRSIVVANVSGFIDISIGAACILVTEGRVCVVGPDVIPASTNGSWSVAVGRISGT